MGGRGSGRRPNPMNIFFPKENHRVVPIAKQGNDPLIIPNYSGAEKFLDNRAAYCSLYLHEGAETITLTKDAYVHLTGFTQGLCQNATVTPDEIVVNKEAIYSINWSVSAKSGVANQVIDIDIFVNGVEEDDGAARSRFSTVNANENMGGTAILHLNKGDSVDLRAKNSTASNDIIIFDMNLSVVEIA